MTVEKKLQKQRAYDVEMNGTMKLREKKKEDEEEDLPPRGTGRSTGTARDPPGTGKPLTDEERKKRHKEKTK